MYVDDAPRIVSGKTSKLLSALLARAKYDEIRKWGSKNGYRFKRIPNSSGELCYVELRQPGNVEQAASQAIVVGNQAILIYPAAVTV